MLQLNLKEILKMRGIKHPQTYLVVHGMSYSEARTLLSSNLSQIKFERLTQLCELFTCTPNDILTWTGSKEHHLSCLICEETKSITQLLEHKSPQQLREISKMLENGEI